MKHLFLILLFTAFLAFHNAGAQYLIDQQEQERVIKGHIKEKVEWEHSYKDGKLNPQGFKASVTTFDTKGNVLEKTNFRYNGDISSKLNYAYDDEGRMTEYIRYDGRRGEYTFKNYYKYDDEGNKIMEHGLSGSAGPFRNYYKYDSKGNLIEISYYSDQILTEKRTIEYAQNIRTISIFQGGTVFTGKIVKKLDARDNLLQEIKYNAAGQEERKYEYKYDSKNHMTQELKYYGTELRERIDYQYDASGNLVKTTYTDPDGSSYVNNMYGYDRNNRLIEEKWYSRQKDEYSSKTYSYNSTGDLIQAKCFYAQFGTQYIYRYQYTKY